jgi:hypothetical protein
MCCESICDDTKNRNMRGRNPSSFVDRPQIPCQTRWLVSIFSHKELEWLETTQVRPCELFIQILLRLHNHWKTFSFRRGFTKLCPSDFALKFNCFGNHFFMTLQALPRHWVPPTLLNRLLGALFKLTTDCFAWWFKELCKSVFQVTSTCYQRSIKDVFQVTSTCYQRSIKSVFQVTSTCYQRSIKGVFQVTATC